MSKNKKTFEDLIVPEENQPYKIPDNWIWMSLKNCLNSIQYGYTETSSLEAIGPKFLRITDIQNDKVDWSNVPYCKITENEFEKYKLEDNDIVVARTGATTGKSYLINKPPASVFASYLIRLRCDDIMFPRFLWEYMKSPMYWNQITVVKKGSAQPGANAQILGNLSVPLPPLEEQKRIAEKVERLLSKIEEAKQLIEEAKTTFELRRAAIIRTIIEEGLNDKLPAGWRRIKVKELFTIFGGGTPSKVKEEYWNGHIPWISAKDMKTTFISETMDYITEEGLENSSTKLAKRGAVVMVVRSGILQRTLPVAYLLTDCTVNQDLKVFDSGNEAINKYFMWYVKGNEKSLLHNYSKSGTTVNSIEFEKFKSHEVLLPPLEVLKRKVEKIENAIDKEERINGILNIVTSVEELKQSILSKAFRGELGTNEPSEESAIELLKQVLQEQVK